MIDVNIDATLIEKGNSNDQPLLSAVEFSMSLFVPKPLYNFSVGTDPLLSMRNHTIYLLLASLLLSNFAGLVHVGCARSTQIAHVANGQAQCRSCSCHHQHSAPLQDASNEPGQHLPAEEHDSDTCNICKSFFAIRSAVFTFIQAIDWRPLPTHMLCVDRATNPAIALFLCGLSVRGPPIA
jgi:hypothetical protein